MTADDTVPVLQRVLAAEHAVVYGYGVAGARLRGGDRAAAMRAWRRHRAARDELTALITARGAEPEQVAPAYELPQPVEDPRSATGLLTLLEDRLAAVWAGAVADLRDDLRERAVVGLTDAAVAAARWRGGSVAFPGLPERALSPST